MANSSIRTGLVGFGIVMIVIIAVFASGVEVPLWAVAVLGVVAMAALILPIAYVKRPVVTLEGSTLSITAQGIDLRINTADLRSAEFRESLATGFLQNGRSNGWLLCGTCNNPEFGDYTICADSDLPAFVVVRFKGQVAVFNLRTVEETRAMYEEIKARVPAMPRRH